MACFIVSAVEAVAVTAVKKGVEKKENTQEAKEVKTEPAKVPMSVKLKWLTWMLWGGVILLAFEHLWHGEITPFFPFLTAMKNKEDMMEMLKEMATVGVCMALLITFVWVVVCVVADSMMKKDTSSVNA
ncbi:MAG: hypothetical protein J6M24_04925 [Lachnospiraceae bacterium]|nr:hypothetical protein [Lachnospiraceae bacterium]